MNILSENIVDMYNEGVLQGIRLCERFVWQQGCKNLGCTEYENGCGDCHGSHFLSEVAHGISDIKKAYLEVNKGVKSEY